MFLKSKRNKTITHKYMSSRRQHPFIVIAMLSNCLYTLTSKALASRLIGPSIFPYTSPGARVKFSPDEGITLKAAVMDGVPSDPGNTQGTKIFLGSNDGALLSAELSYAPADVEMNAEIT